jgi:hypothetical protein
MLYLDELDGTGRICSHRWSKYKEALMIRMLNGIKDRNRNLSAIRFVKRYNLMNDEDISEVLSSRSALDNLKDKILLEGRVIKQRKKNGAN